VAYRPPKKLPPTGVVDVDILGAHTHSTDHRPDLFHSERCGCFYCLAIFPADAIDFWIDVVDGVGVTAMCPECGIDSVIGSASGYPIEEWFLQRMQEHWMRASE
jgi:hypothetical protein